MAITDSSFSRDVLSSSVPVLVDFWAPWCKPCKSLTPVLEEIASEKAAELRVVKLDVDANPNTPQELQVVSISDDDLVQGRPCDEADRRRKGQGRPASRTR